MISGPTFRSSDIRRTMDVFGLDGGKLGTIISVTPGPVPATPEEAHLPGIPEVREFDGESIGPAPTRELGNFGPETQTPEREYGTAVTHGEALGDGSILIGTYYGWFGWKRIPLSEVQTVSLERIVLRYPASHYQ